MIKRSLAAASLAGVFLLAAGVWAPSKAEAARRPRVSIASARVSPRRVKSGTRLTVIVKLRVSNATVSSVTVKTQVLHAAAAGPGTTLTTTAANTYSGSISAPVNTTGRRVSADVWVTVVSSAGRPITKRIARISVDPGDPNLPPPPPDI